jgi:hypothetical protein
MIASVDTRVRRQLKVGGVIDIVGADSLFLGDERVGAAVAAAVASAHEWIDAG